MGQDENGVYGAFVSYSHADKRAAQKLHRRLENYRLPEHIAKALYLNAGAGDPARLGRIFRDREDLPAAEDLSSAVKAALQASEALVVLCSPNAKASRWVAREIELFRELHPDRPILAALLDGEPADAFPEALLQGREPVAADLRKQGDGPRLGFLKIVAGIAAVPLDTLVQRDAQRRIRRVMAVTCGAVLAMLAMVIMTIIAIQARNEADKQRAEAEGLVEYMLTDLRDELQDRSTLPVMTKVNKRLLDYYDSQGDLNALPADSLLRRARNIHAMGDNDEKRGDKVEALKRFKEAYRVTKSLLRQAPQEPNHIFVHGQSEYYLGYMAYLAKDWPNTQRHWTEYKNLSDQLVKQDGRKIKWLREAGYADGNLCTLALAKKESDNSLLYCRNALDRMEQVLARNPVDAGAVQDVVNRIAWLSEVYLQAGDSKMRMRLLLRGVQLVDKLRIDDPGNNDLTDVWLTFQLGLMKMDETASPVQLKAALNAARDLVRHDPSNRVWRKRLQNLEKLN